MSLYQNKNSRDTQMRVNLSLSVLSLLTASILVGCGSSSGGDSDDTPKTTINQLTPQTGTSKKLFYGNSKHDALGALKDIKLLNSTSLNDTLDSSIRRPYVSTAIANYDATTNSYTGLDVDTVYYSSGSIPFKLSMVDGLKSKNCTDNNLTKLKYKTINYLGTRVYLTATNSHGEDVLITPNMSESDTPLPFENKTLLTLAYDSYGADINGYIVYDSNLSKLQNCTTDMATCIDIANSDKPIFLGDIGGDVKSLLSVNNEPFILDKKENTFTKIEGVTLPKKVGHTTPYSMSGKSIFFFKDGNLSRVDLNGTVQQISNDGKANRIKAFTDDMLIYGGDDYMYAVKKDGSSTTPIEISVTTKTKGQKYPMNMAIGNQYLYNLYSLNPSTGKMTFRACKLEDSKIECKNNSFWSAVTASKSGKLNFTSNYKYKPYAYIRIDNTDNYGGGTLKAIDPTKPMEDGISLGSVATYNFQTFVNGGYMNELIDRDGDIILYAKNDLNFKGDAFLVNLNRANSLKNISNEKAPTISELTGRRGHCHGRYCSICHSFSGGKIYIDKNGTKSAKDHTIKFEFENGDTLLAKIRKGIGENFNTPLENLVGKNFTARVIDKNGTVVNHSNEFSHRGAEYFNCNFCHARKGNLKHDAPSVITIEE